MATRPLKPVSQGSQAMREALTAARDTAGPAPTSANGATPAPQVVTLPPSAFAETWKGRPKEPVRIGLRLVSESDSEKARANATASADRYFAQTSRDSDEYAQHWNGVVMRQVLAQAMCRAEDVAQPWFRQMAEDMVGVALNERGVVRLWQGYSELREKLSPLLRVANDEEVAEAAVRLADPKQVAALPAADRRLLGRILDDMRSRD